MSTPTVCTIVARNYLAQAHVFVTSFQRHNPGVRVMTLIIDGDADDRLLTTVGDVVLPEDLGVEPLVLHEMIVMYDVMELATALKPSLLMHALRSGASSAAYFDPDIKVYAPLHDVLEAARIHDIVLTPHTLHPLPRDGKRLTERDIMLSGIYNLGFIGVGPGAFRFLSWWHERLETDAIVDIANALFTDQRWIDWAPSLFRHHISRDPGLNAAYWNLHERTVAGPPDNATVSGVPLRFFHFSGYDPAKPWLLSKHFGERPRTLLSEQPALADLCDDYGADLEAAGHLQMRKNPYRLDFLPNGLRISREIRRLVRDIRLGDLRPLTPLPDPITESDAFTRWLLTPGIGFGPDKPSPAAYSWWQGRDDLRKAFPDVLGADARRYLDWVENDPWPAARTSEIVAALPPADDAVVDDAAPAGTARRAFGWSVIAHATSELGIGETGRRTANMVSRSGIPTELVAAPAGNLSRQNHRPRLRIATEPGYENVIVCANADEIGRIETIMRLGELRGRRIGLWFWELSEFPDTWRASFDSVDEVWTASEFARASIQAATGKAVRNVPLAIEAPTRPTRFTRRSLGLPEGEFVFLANFDYFSVHKRKNPAGAIEAYLRAFEESDGARLVIKSINGDKRPLDVEHVKSVAGRRRDVVFLDEYVSAAGMKGMIEHADCYVSLHRSEGYGLNMADAMARRTPVIATAYSGNLDYMTPETAELIPYELVEVGPDAFPYAADATWAEPDLGAAAAAMRRIFEDADHARDLADRAFVDATTRFSAEATAGIVRDLLMAPYREDHE